MKSRTIMESRNMDSWEKMILLSAPCFIVDLSSEVPHNLPQLGKNSTHFDDRDYYR